MKKFLVYPVLILLFPLAVLLGKLSAGHPAVTERLYSRRIYTAVSAAVSSVTGLFPFSVAEILLCLAALCLLAFLVRCVIRLRRIRPRGILRFVLTAVCIFCAGYFLFTVMWGLNYNREPLIDNLGYKKGTVTKEELSSVLTKEIRTVNALCDKITFDSAEHSAYPGGLSGMQGKINSGYAALAKQNPLFNTNRTHPKAVLLSVLMSYSGIDGIYIPFTCEPCVNTFCPPFALAFNMAHESAHFKGFAREDEANYVAYLANSLNGDAYFRYSAHMFAYIYISNALYATDEKLWNSIASGLDPRAASDIQYYNDYVNRFSGPVQQISNKINDSYLKSQGQQGVVSYSLFVNLLCAKYRTEKASAG